MGLYYFGHVGTKNCLLCPKVTIIMSHVMRKPTFGVSDQAPDTKWAVQPQKLARGFIMKTSLCNVHPLTPHFYIVKLELTGVFIIFLFLL